MKLKKLTLENFRSFKGKHEIEFSPITLLFGGNSVGKSSITKAIHHFDSLSEKDVFHGENSVTVALQFEGEMSKKFAFFDLEQFQPVELLSKDKKYFSFVEDFISHTFAIEKINKKQFGNHVEDYRSDSDSVSYNLNEQWLCKMVDGPNFKDCLLKFNSDHELILRLGLESQLINLNKRFSSLEGESSGYVNYLINTLIECDNADGESTYTQLKYIAKKIAYENEKLRYPILELSSIILILRAVNKAVISYSKLEHLGPLRKLPDIASKTSYPLELNVKRDGYFFKLGDRERAKSYSGESAWESLTLPPLDLSTDIDVLSQVNDWLINWFNTPYQIKFIETYSYEIDSEEKRVKLKNGQVSKEDLVGLEKKVRFLNIQNGSTTSASEIGVGISQLTPVIVHALDSERFSVEQPELHIHPRMQSIVADLFVFEGLYQTAGNERGAVRISTKNLDGSMAERHFDRKEAGTESFILIETHSEHLMLRLLKRMREEILKPDDLAIYYFDNDCGQTKVTKIGVDQEGEFTTPWPQGFFEERLEELF
ncbi:DUF3696 domain-containing protein [Thiomicrospira microaerophila]|uniref:DUF3696 domain-containing protein n=1 Tax=Thiomicrospira microaerophila TaxID=406020 RepID=UPI0005CAC4D4|nr:DUF3696 domain-containing protein [Thiomicrospira microaerophila]